MLRIHAKQRQPARLCNLSVAAGLKRSLLGKSSIDVSAGAKCNTLASLLERRHSNSEKTEGRKFSASFQERLFLQQGLPEACDYNFIIEFLYTVSAKCSFVEVGAVILARRCCWRKCGSMGFLLTHISSNT